MIFLVINNHYLNILYQKWKYQYKIKHNFILLEDYFKDKDKI